MFIHDDYVVNYEINVNDTWAVGEWAALSQGAVNDLRRELTCVACGDAWVRCERIFVFSDVTNSHWGIPTCM